MTHGVNVGKFTFIHYLTNTEALDSYPAHSAFISTSIWKTAASAQLAIYYFYRGLPLYGFLMTNMGKSTDFCTCFSRVFRQFTSAYFTAGTRITTM